MADAFSRVMGTKSVKYTFVPVNSFGLFSPVITADCTFLNNPHMNGMFLFQLRLSHLLNDLSLCGEGHPLQVRLSLTQSLSGKRLGSLISLISSRTNKTRLFDSSFDFGAKGFFSEQQFIYLLVGTCFISFLL